jgi:hypothetical protein
MSHGNRKRWRERNLKRSWIRRKKRRKSEIGEEKIRINKIERKLEVKVW